jgi:hypothetical protein
MAALPYDSLSFILWLIWYYPGMIIIACVLCHVSVKIADEAAVGILSDGTDKSVISTHSKTRTELGESVDHLNPDSGAGHIKDSDESRLPNFDEQLSLGQNFTDRGGESHRSHPKTSPLVYLKIAIFWQVVQICLLERMGHMAAKDRIQTGDPIFGSVIVLALCTILVLSSTAALQERWNGARCVETATGAGSGTEINKPKSSSRLVLAAMLSVLLPWYELMTARYSP